MKKLLLQIVVLVFFCSVSVGQNLDVCHFMRTSPFRHFDTPSCSSIYNGYVSLPGGMVHIGANLGSIRYYKLFETDNQGYPVTLTATRFVNSLAKNNYLGVNSSVELWGFGFRVKNFYFTLDHRLRVNGDIRYSKALFGLPVYGNISYLDKPADMNVSANVNVYQEIGVGIRHEINDKMSWGVRPKVLFGIANLHAKKLSAVLTTDPVNYGLSMMYDAEMQAAAIVPFSLTFDEKHGFNFNYSINSHDITSNIFKNLGFGLDLGFTYKPLPSINLSVGVLDLGYIYWKTSPTQMSSVMYDAGRFYDAGSLVFAGMTPDDIQMLIDGGNVRDLLDTFAHYFPLDVGSCKPYATAIPMRVVFQGDYEFAKHHCVSAAAQFRFASKYVQPSLTLAYDGCFFNSIDVCVSYTLQRKAADNLGVGLGFNLGYLNVYFGTQNLVAAMSYLDASQITATAGLVFNWGHYKNWREKNPKEEKNQKEGKKKSKG